MSLPVFSTQAELFSTAGLSGQLFAPTDRYRLFAQKVYPILAQTRSQLEDCYCTDNGRVAVEPVLLLGVSLLQYLEAIPDRQAVELVRYHAGWNFALIRQVGIQYEYAVLVPSLTDEVRTIAQHYRDRGDVENNFDELKNQWGWAGFTTQDRKRCQIMGRIIALVYNWWTIFMRLGIPGKHAEAITSRPLALQGVARQTRHGNQTTVEIPSTHAKAM